ncbi:MAG: DUF4038 domain-containing protein [Saprospiraceae bacterium]|nr:DUF4038 domain-containing protein [Saprospiraceae bacterium]
MFFIFLYQGIISCNHTNGQDPVKPRLSVSENQRFLKDIDGSPFLWIGGTVWGMSEWLSREEIDYYLDDRQKKGFNVVQVCLFWGKRTDDPVDFTANPPNFYGHSCFTDQDGIDPLTPAIRNGGSPEESNDYWDHVDYMLEAMRKRSMIAAVLPVWGRRYVNATHPNFSQSIFTPESMYEYGRFLGNRYRHFDHIIWVLGGDVQADFGGDFLGHYRAMAEGINFGITGERCKWNENSRAWDFSLMTYHPDGAPLKNSSRWFHQDVWLDFNMIETFVNVNSVYAAVEQDYQKREPVKPTVMGEPGYENHPGKEGTISATQVRRQAWQSFFAGAAGFTYGGFRDSLGNGPLFTPFRGWKQILDWEGAGSLAIISKFCLEQGWPDWTPRQEIVVAGRNEGEFMKAVVKVGQNRFLVFFPDNTEISLKLESENHEIKLSWYNSLSNVYQDGENIQIEAQALTVSPPAGWTEGILILELK